jgi:PTS system ascorbate-specific IIB component
MSIKVLAVCGLGIGSSIVLKINATKVFQSLGVDFNLEVADIGTAKSIPFDVAITSNELAETLKNGVSQDRKEGVIPINNFVDLDEMKAKVEEFLKRRQLI